MPLHSVFDNATLAFAFPGTWEWLVLLIIGLLIFGRRLPEVGRSLGQGIVEFKRGIKGIDDEIQEASNKSSRTLPEEAAEAEQRSRSEEPIGHAAEQSPRPS